MNVNDYVFINRIVLKFVGLYPISIERYIVCICCITLIVIPQLMQIYYEWRDLNTVLEISSVLFTIALAILKSLVWMLNRRNLQPFIDFMLTDYWRLVNNDASKHLEVYATYAKRITQGYLFLICNALLFFFSLPIIDIFFTWVKGTNNNNRKHFPFLASYPTAFYNFPLYEIAYVSQMVATGICGLVILATDTLIATALFHTCGHFKVLHENFKNLKFDIYIINNFRNNPKHINRGLRDIKLNLGHIIKHHQIVLGFCENMEKNFHLMLFFQTMASSLIICLVGVQVSTTLTERSKLIKYFSYLIMALFQLLLFCFPGDVLIYQSSSVSNAIYSIQWYEIPVPIKTEVCMLTLRGQKPSCITAGKLYVMHIENFSAVLSTALSYFMMFRSFNVKTDS